MNSKNISVSITLIISLILITPLCGFLFQCGCDWPWFGLDTDCNSYKLDSFHQCPWCASMLSGVLSTGVAVMSAVCVAFLGIPLITLKQSVIETPVRVVAGLTAFTLVSIITAGVAALWQDYPLGIGALFSTSN